MSNWLKKSVLTAATVLSMQFAAAQTHEYDVKCNFGFISAEAGVITYNQDARKMTVDVDLLTDVSFTYQMINDSLYIETNTKMVKDTINLYETYLYFKKNDSWSLKKYIVSTGVAREEKLILKDSVYDSSFMSPIESLEYLLEDSSRDEFADGDKDYTMDKLKDSVNILVFGIPYTLDMKKNSLRKNKVRYDGIILPFETSKKDNFLIEDAVRFITQKHGEEYLLKSIDAKVKIKWKFKAGIKVRSKDN